MRNARCVETPLALLAAALRILVRVLAGWAGATRPISAVGGRVLAFATVAAVCYDQVATLEVTPGIAGAHGGRGGGAAEQKKREEQEGGAGRPASEKSGARHLRRETWHLCRTRVGGFSFFGEIKNNL